MPFYKLFPFPSGTIETFTHTTNEGARNNISLRNLNLRQSVAMCLIYLAKGYQYKFGIRSDDFMLACAEKSLSYDALNLSAMLLKAEVLEDRIVAKNKSFSLLKGDAEFEAYQDWLAHIYKLGYREMPMEMKNLLVKGWTKDSTTYIFTKDHRLRISRPAENKTRYASLSWGVFDEEIYTLPVEQYGRTLFDTKTEKIKGFTKEYRVYNDYNFDPVAFAWNIDPLAHKLPSSFPYAFCLGNPILNYDPDGAFPYSIHVRSFAPFATFGGGFEGDGAARGYSIALSKAEGGRITSRVQHASIVDPTAGTFNPGNVWCDQSSHPILGKATATAHGNVSGFKATKDNEGNITAMFTTNMAAANPLVPGSPDIDVHTKFTLTENVKAGTLNVHAVQTGDAFPSAETFIGDTRGNQLFIGVSPAIGNPYTSLPGDGDTKMMSADFTVSIDKDGVFTGVKQGDKSYSTSEWNSMIQMQPTTKK